jgi:predicted nicotinamide N-methyase
MSSEHVYHRSSAQYVDEIETVSVVHERGRGIAWRIWPGAHVLLDWLEKNPSEWLSHPCHCIEIGAGVGLVGVVCAGLGSDLVTLTDLPEELPALDRSVASNKDELKKRLRVMPLSFGNMEEIKEIVTSSPNGSNLVVVGSELIYWETLFVPIAETLRELVVNNKGVAFLGYRKRVWKTEKRFFTKVLKQFGLEAEVKGQWLAIEEDGSSQKTDGNVVYTECLGEEESDEWNTRVYKITAVRKIPLEDNSWKKKEHQKAPEIKQDEKAEKKKKPAKIVKQEKKGRVR